MRNFYGYKVTMRAVHSRTLTTNGRERATSKRTEADTALITLYRKAESLEHLQQNLIGELPTLRKISGMLAHSQRYCIGVQHENV